MNEQLTTVTKLLPKEIPQFAIRFEMKMNIMNEFHVSLKPTI